MSEIIMFFVDGSNVIVDSVTDIDSFKDYVKNNPWIEVKNHVSKRNELINTRNIMKISIGVNK